MNEKVKITVVKIQDESDDDPIYCVVMGLYGIIEKYTFEPLDETVNGYTTYNISFSATSKMAPAAEVLLYYVHSSGEIIFDKVELNVDDEISNKVSIKTKLCNLKRTTKLY